VCIRDVKEAFSVRPRFPGSFEYLVLDVQDSEEQNLIRLFPRYLSQIFGHYLVLMYLIASAPNNSLTPLFLEAGVFWFTVTV
jgi:hypothetical protein